MWPSELRGSLTPAPCPPGSPLVSLRLWSYGFSGVGIITMLLGFLGCLGALKEVKVMLGLVSWGAGGPGGVTELGGGWGSCAATSWGDRGATWCHHILCLGSSSGEGGPL